MNWLYKGEEMSSLEDFPPSTFGFTYRVTHISSGKMYIGKKVLKFSRKAKLTKKDLALYEGTKGRKPTYKQVIKESDWKTYWGSSDRLQADIDTHGKEKFTREIIRLCNTRGETNYCEAYYQFIEGVLLKENNYNGIINIRLGGNSVKGLLLEDLNTKTKL